MKKRMCAKKSVTTSPDDVFCTTFCNKPHRLSDGVPLNHECYVLKPAGLRHERDGVFLKKTISTGTPHPGSPWSPLTKTDEVLLSMMRQNAGGGMYGTKTMAQVNREKDLFNEPSVRFSVEGDDIYVTFSTFHWLRHFLEYDPVLSEKFHEWNSERPMSDGGRRDMDAAVPVLWPEGVSGHHDEQTEPRVYYTYNNTTFLSQDFQFLQVHVDEDAWALLQTHNGVDARCGLSTIEVFKFKHDFDDPNHYDFIHRAGSAGISCSGSASHRWVTEDAGYKWHAEESDAGELVGSCIKMTKTGYKCPMCKGRLYASSMVM